MGRAGGVKKMLSVVIPVFNEEASIRDAVKEIGGKLEAEKISYELLFVDDGSQDHTWERIREEAGKDTRVRGISFSRNFGKEAAMLAGLYSALGACVAVMDCDLQHPPEKLIEMYRLWENGYQVIEGVKEDRGKESFFYRLATKIFYGIVGNSIGYDFRNASDFKLLDRKAVDEICKMPEAHFFFRALSSWIGFRTAEVRYRVGERRHGRSKWNTGALFRYGFRNITSFTTAPLQMVTIGGIIFLIFAVVLGIQTLVRFITGHAQEGFTTVILVQLISSSIIMVGIGIVGYYIARIYDEVRRRPRYIIAEEIKHETAGTD